MQYLKDQGFVIKRINFGDSDRYLTLFTKNNGRIEVLARGVRKITSRRAGSVELLNLVNFQAVKSSKNHVLTEVSLIDSFNSLKYDLKNIRKVFLMCELIEAIMPYGEKHEDVFDLMERALNVAEEEKTLAYFQAKLLSLLGFWDGKTVFRDELHVQSVIEQTIERKLKTRIVFKI
ncbi:MAG TPA: DNA repair protein RecO [Patescibacteria group bacterium]|nr:DNA repair protein RecO [Patescibacteria group bacterium]